MIAMLKLSTQMLAQLELNIRFASYHFSLFFTVIFSKGVIFEIYKEYCIQSQVLKQHTSFTYNWESY